MCGIAGYVSFGADITAKRPIIEKMCELLHHRGPDGSGIWMKGEAGLAHRRLSIIDLAGGAQPMESEDGSVCVVFNGEIYNFQELREELIKKGFKFRTRSDTEVILHGYRAYGTEVVNKLNGMFAFALWDDSRKRLFAARDRLGKKPFYYYATGSRFLFASEMKSILAEPEVPRKVLRTEVDRFLSFGYIPSPGTIFEGIFKLQPGHFLIAEGGKVTLTRYWDVEYRPSSDCRTEGEYLEKFDSLLRASIKRRLISDVPLGAFLSGGMDSSTIVGLMAQVAGTRIKTFTIGFEDKEYSELADGALVAKHFGTEHTEFIVKPDAMGILETLAWHFDEPFADSSAVPTYYVSQMARREVTVVLSGDGGDELFAGYNSYHRPVPYKVFQAIPAALRQSILGRIGSALPIKNKAKNFLQALGEIEAAEGVGLIEMFPRIKSKLYSRSMSEGLASSHRSISVMDYWTGAPAAPRLSRLQYFDTKLFLPDDVLMKVDRMSMANSLETRAPFLDYHLVEFAATIPAEMQIKDGGGKYLMRKLGERFLPDSILKKKKQGFALPRDKWFRGEMKDYARDMLTSSRFIQRGYFRPEAIETILTEHARGSRDYSIWIWCLINLELWHRLYLDADTRRV